MYIYNGLAFDPPGRKYMLSARDLVLQNVGRYCQLPAFRSTCMLETPTAQALRMARELRLVRPRDLTARGLPHTLLAQLNAQGRLERVGRGLYRLPEYEATPDI